MKALIGLALPACLILAACVEQPVDQTTGDRMVDPSKLPEDVRAMAAPDQNLADVRVMATDGCYWYRYNGPVETTYLPLRTVDGRPICTRPQ